MQFFPVDTPWPGRLAVCSRPRSGSWLEDDIRALRTAGFDLLVSALTPEEVSRLELETVPQLCSEFGVEFVHFPIGNLMVPELDAALPQLETWRCRLSEGRGVAIHCWGSAGRSPTLVAALLVLGGVATDEAWQRVESARGREVPDTNEQREWVAEVAGRGLA